MARKGSWNPIAFVPTQVTIISSAVYIALFAVLLWVHTTVPSAPSNPVPVSGLNLTEAWLDLDFITDGYHPIDSTRNDKVREYLVRRIEEILERNGQEYMVVRSGKEQSVSSKKKDGKKETSSKAVTLFAQDWSNATFIGGQPSEPWTCYGESSNVLVYIRGKQDEAGDWWEQGGRTYEGQSGVLVNAHYDSVSSGYGATDDGVGVVTVMQLISFFTTEGNQPERGIVALLNNGEENGLYGAHNYLRHPLAGFAHTFLNLEGAGAGGRAVLFRSTDAEVTSFYSKSTNPVGSVIFGDGFKRGFVRSGTDYSVFTSGLGMRGLDVAFFEPRSRYHTSQDDVKNTNPDSLWHMLSASLETVKGLTSYNGDEFEGSANRDGKLVLSQGSTGVWFDLFGQAFAVCKLNTLFALSVSLLVAAPIILIVVEILLARNDKWYLFARKGYLHSADDDEPVLFYGFRGFFRFPVAFVLATAAVLAIAYLVTIINPEILYSSEYAVWAMMLSLYISVAWLFLAGADRIRPTALQRMYCLIWIYALSWMALVAATVGENNFQLASGYIVVIYNAATFAALLISYFELMALPTKKKYVEHATGVVGEHDTASDRRGSQSSRTLLRHSDDRAETGNATDEEEVNERSSLLRSGGKRRQDQDLAEGSDDPFLNKAYGDEQAWSSSLPQWTWILQFFILAPINIIVVGQLALLITSALHQTPADGNSVVPIYMIIAALSIVLLLPLTPFLHRFTYHIPSLLFLVFIGCLIYNLLAFPFSREARLKHYFLQQIDLDSGINTVSLTGIDGYLQEIIDELPSAAGQSLHCGDADDSRRAGLRTCSWHGIHPHVVPDTYDDLDALAHHRKKNNDSSSNPPSYPDWLTYNITSTNSTASFTLQGQHTKQCRLVFSNPVTDVRISGASASPHFPTVDSDKGTYQVRLFSRDWDKVFQVNVTWPDEQPATKQTGKVMCMWSDVNVLGTIPAFDEVRRFEPVWAAVTKAGDGLVEGWKGFVV